MASHEVSRAGARQGRYSCFMRRAAVRSSCEQQCASTVINSKQLDDKFPLELVFLFARHVHWPFSAWQFM